MNTIRFYAILYVSVVAVCLTASSAKAVNGDVDDKTLPPYFFIKGEGTTTDPGLVEAFVIHMLSAFGVHSDESTMLDLVYSVLTQYTSVVAIDHIVRRNPGEPPKMIKPPLPLQRETSTTTVGSRVHSMPKPNEPLLLFIAAMLIAFALRPQKGKDGETVRR